MTRQLDNVFRCKDEQKKIQELHRWKYFLREKRKVALQVIDRCIDYLHKIPTMKDDPMAKARVISQLRNATAVPEDFNILY